MRDHRSFTCFGQRKSSFNPCIHRFTISFQSNATIIPESPLALFLEKAISLTPDERAHLLEKTELFASIHESTAQLGQSQVPVDLDTNLHFIAYIQALDPKDHSPRLLELDGRRPFAFDRGPSTDLLQVLFAGFMLPIY